MNVRYHGDGDVLRILFRDVPVAESNEEKPGVIFDYDKDGLVVGIEILNASEQIINPREIEYELLEPMPT